MSDLRQAAAAALEALEGVLDTYGEPLDKLSIAGGTYEALYCRDAITALRAALAEPERQPLTDEEIDQIAIKCLDAPEPGWNRNLARAIERAHGIGEAA